MPGCLQPLSSGRPKILAHISGIQTGHTFFISNGFFYSTNLLCFGELHGWSGGGDGSCIRWVVSGAFLHSGFTHVWTEVSISVFWTIVCHVTLQMATKAPSFLGQLHMFFWVSVCWLLCSDQAFTLTWGFLEWCWFWDFCSCHLQHRYVVRGCLE